MQPNIDGKLRQIMARKMQDNPEFAGEYVILEQPCSSDGLCTMTFLVNRRTGKVVPTFFQTRTSKGTEQKRVRGEWVRMAKVDSRLLVTREVTPGKNGERTRYANKYYVLSNDDLKLITKTELTSPDTARRQ